jgi:hypothetical protein
MSAAMADDTPPTMDYPAHEATYNGFVQFLKVGILTCASVLLSLLVVSYKGTAPFLGSLALFLSIAAAILGLVTSATWKPPAYAFAFTLLVALYALA